jgi:hypothetical protein
MLELIGKGLSEDGRDVVIDVDGGAEGLKLTLVPELDAVVLDVVVPAGAPPDCAD